ncbi:MAG: hypothetical protein ACYC6P_09755 [Ignavibacteriaceae bacterium]
MENNKYKTLVEELLELAGINVSGSNSYDIQMLDERFYKRVISEVELGLGESFMDD